MAVKDGLPATDFSRMNREWVRAVVNGDGGLPPVTEADNGKILGVVNGAWGAMDAGGGGGSSDYSTAVVTVINTTAKPRAIKNVIMISGNPPERYFSYDSELYISAGETNTLPIPMIDGHASFEATEEGVTITTSDNISYSDGVFGIEGNGTITFSPVS